MNSVATYLSKVIAKSENLMFLLGIQYSALIPQLVLSALWASEAGKCFIVELIRLWLDQRTLQYVT